MPDFKSKERFSNRVANYVKYRPKYPVEIIAHLQETVGLTPDSVVADIGVGTGISAEHFIDFGNTVYGIEPNADMLQAAQEFYAGNAQFKAIDATAEATTLEDDSVDLIIAGQAFHWFDPTDARAEWKRILKPNGHVALIWNDRLTKGLFLEQYEAFLVKHGTDYGAVNHRRIDLNVVQQFFDPEPASLSIFPNEQQFDFEGLKGRVLSSSYVPNSTDPGFPDMLQNLKMLFAKHARNGSVSIDYDTQVYTGKL